MRLNCPARCSFRAHPCLIAENAKLNEAETRELIRQARATRDLSRKYHLLFTQDGHSRGSVEFAHETLDILGPDALLSHSTDLTAEEIEICRKTNTRIVHNPSAIASITGRCPATELLDAGVTVMLGSDGVAPDRSFDMFKPHLMPLNMPVYRLAYFASGNDVDTVIVNGRLLMEHRQVKTVNEAHVLELAQKEADNALRRTSLSGLLALPQRFWNTTRGLPTK